MRKFLIASIMLWGCGDSSEPGVDTSTSDIDTSVTPDTDTTGDTDITPDTDTTGDTDITPDTDTTGDTDVTPDTDTTGDTDITPDTDTPDTDTSDTLADTTPGDTTVPEEIDPTVALVFELRWTNIGTGGVDLDLQVAHPSANGVFYTHPWVVFWDNRAPDWGVSGNTADDPRILADSTDGSGAEIIEVRLPEDGLRYCAGIHHWAPAGKTTVGILRIYSNGVRIHENTSPTLSRLDLWEPVCITWGGTAATSTFDEPSKVTPNYSHPNYPPFN